VIAVTIVPDALICGRPTDVVIVVANRSQTQSAHGVVIEFEPDGLVRLDHGASPIEIQKLRPGDVDNSHRVTLKGRRPGVGHIGLPYVSYWTDSGRWTEQASPPLSIRIDPRPEPDPPDTPSASTPAQEPQLPSAFISHRRDDSGWLGPLLKMGLRPYLPGSNIFLDHDLGPGDEWPRELDQALDSANALLALIGPSWETLTDESGIRRIQLPNDIVRHEIATALRRQILIIPVRHGRTALPRAADLPPDLLPLREHQAIPVEPQTLPHAIRDIAIKLRQAGLS
jgi:hypothetical protein